jgi:hypothetical protein
MSSEITNTALSPLRLLWRFTGRPIYERLIGRYFAATISRLNTTLGELGHVRAQLDAVRRELELSHVRQDELARQMRAVTAGYWDGVAVSRRLAAIEDRIHADTPAVPPPPGSDEAQTESDGIVDADRLDPA